MKKYIKACFVIAGLILSGFFFCVFAVMEMPFLAQFFMVAFGLLSIRHSFRKFYEKS
jgi:hypothetical protein